MTELALAAQQLLRRCRHGALATQSTVLPGYPHASLLPYACALDGSPLFVISQLAEHTQNLLADARASLLVHESIDGSVLTQPRLTVLGRVERDDDAANLARLLRYQPDAARYLQLGDFALYRMHIERARYIAGFGRMGWLTGPELGSGWQPSTEDEASCLAQPVGGQRGEPLGVDAYGLDWLQDNRIKRFDFAQPAASVAEMIAQAQTCRED
ncbi:HugZ family pyridoxamine 5'-phosphate oxidase [Andreprevotia chitinilytica]|uniref:HugZ family pyridoxamine 5'-phosphate oxidase n=1 Tax=Andreprevotia chitinilytica TaxID=396808 RepID=UPI0005567810|nr:pyridoxamine 5'-phosphate oxidase family protein [Andreprevotia chitinilytica]